MCRASLARVHALRRSPRRVHPGPWRTHSSLSLLQPQSACGTHPTARISRTWGGSQLWCIPGVHGRRGCEPGWLLHASAAARGGRVRGEVRQVRWRRGSSCIISSAAHCACAPPFILPQGCARVRVPCRRKSTVYYIMAAATAANAWRRWHAAQHIPSPSMSLYVEQWRMRQRAFSCGCHTLYRSSRLSSPPPPEVAPCGQEHTKPTNRAISNAKGRAQPLHHRAPAGELVLRTRPSRQPARRGSPSLHACACVRVSAQQTAHVSKTRNAAARPTNDAASGHDDDIIS